MCSSRKIDSKVLRTAVVPAPEEPVTAMMGCLRDMLCRVGESASGRSCCPGMVTTKNAVCYKRERRGPCLSQGRYRLEPRIGLFEARAKRIGFLLAGKAGKAYAVQLCAVGLLRLDAHRVAVAAQAVVHGQSFELLTEVSQI